MSKHICRLALVAFMFFALMVGVNCMAGGRYSEDAKYFTSVMYKELIRGKYCTSISDCNKKQLVFGEHDESVCFNFYGVVDQVTVREIESALRKLSIEHSVPLTLNFYEEQKKELLGLQRLFSKPRTKVEINK